MEEPVAEREEPDVSMNRQTDVDNKENSNGPSTEDPSVDRYKITPLLLAFYLG